MVPIDALYVLHNNEDNNHLFFKCSYTKILWWDVCDKCDISRMTKGWDEWIQWATVTWHDKSFVNFSLNWVSQLQCIISGKNEMHGSLQVCLELRI
jgi:hypothetical protein